MCHRAATSAAACCEGRCGQLVSNQRSLDCLEQRRCKSSLASWAWGLLRYGASGSGNLGVCKLH